MADLINNCAACELPIEEGRAKTTKYCLRTECIRAKGRWRERRSRLKRERTKVDKGD